MHKLKVCIGYTFLQLQKKDIRDNSHYLLSRTDDRDLVYKSYPAIKVKLVSSNESYTQKEYSMKTQTFSKP